VNREQAAVGFRVKTARATAVVLGGSRFEPRALERRSVELWDPAFPDTKQPYHAALDLPEDQGAQVVKQATQAVQSIATRSLREMLERLRESGCELRGIGLVVGSNSDPAKLSNAHIRAHALEGRLFWRVLQLAADGLGIACLSVVEREMPAKAEAALGRPAEELRRIAAELGKPLGRPWGAEEKSAALAGWMALVR
jgi:hypothetical protein